MVVKLSKFTKLVWALVISNLASIIYFGLVASPVYSSNASVMVRSGESAGSNMTALLSGATGNGTEFGGYVFQDFVKSWNEFERLRDRLKLAQNFRNGDLISRYGGLSTFFGEDDIDLWHYYQKSLTVDVDTKSGIVSLVVRGFDPEFVHRLADVLMRDAVTHLTEMNAERERQMMQAAQLRVGELMAQLHEQEKLLANQRSRSGIYEPADLYQSRLNLLNELTLRQTEITAQYNAVLKETPNSPAAMDLLSALSAIESKIAEEKRRTSQTSRESAAHDDLKARRDITVSLLTQASAAVHEAQLDAVSNGYFLNVISQPSRPQTAELPHRFRWIVGIFLISILAWGILR